MMQALEHVKVEVKNCSKVFTKLRPKSKRHSNFLSSYGFFLVHHYTKPLKPYAT